MEQFIRDLIAHAEKQNPVKVNNSIKLIALTQFYIQSSLGCIDYQIPPKNKILAENIWKKGFPMGDIFSVVNQAYSYGTNIEYMFMGLKKWNLVKNSFMGVGEDKLIAVNEILKASHLPKLIIIDSDGWNERYVIFAPMINQIQCCDEWLWPNVDKFYRLDTESLP